MISKARVLQDCKDRRSKCLKVPWVFSFQSNDGKKTDTPFRLWVKIWVSGRRFKPATSPNAQRIVGHSTNLLDLAQMGLPVTGQFLGSSPLPSCPSSRKSAKAPLTITHASVIRDCSWGELVPSCTQASASYEHEAWCMMNGQTTRAQWYSCIFPEN